MSVDFLDSRLAQNLKKLQDDGHLPAGEKPQKPSVKAMGVAQKTDDPTQEIL